MDFLKSCCAFFTRFSLENISQLDIKNQFLGIKIENLQMLLWLQKLIVDLQKIGIFVWQTVFGYYISSPLFLLLWFGWVMTKGCVINRYFWIHKKHQLNFPFNSNRTRIMTWPTTNTSEVNFPLKNILSLTLTFFLEQ